MARYMRKSLFSVTATQKNDIFSRYLLCLIQETQQQKWLMDENINFIWAGPHCCSFLCEGRAVQTLPFNRCCEIMRDLSQADRYFQLFRAFMLSRSALQTAAVLTCCSDAAVSLFLLLWIWPQASRRAATPGMTVFPFNAVRTRFSFQPAIKLCFVFLLLCFPLFTPCKNNKKGLNLNRNVGSLCTSYLFSNESSSLCARLLRLQYFSLASETQEIINMTCQTIEHNDLSLIPLARESLMFLLQKIDLLHTGAALTETRGAMKSERTSNT